MSTEKVDVVQQSAVAYVRRRRRDSRILFIVAVLLPTVIASIYFGLIASDIYISESSFVVRSPDRQAPTALGVLLEGVGFSNSRDDTYSVHSFILSRDALRRLDEKLDLRSGFSNHEIDRISRFNGFGWDDSFEALFLYYINQVEVQLDSSGAISMLTVRAFTADDAWKINEQLLEMSEELINRLNERGRQDMLRYAMSEVEEAEKQARLAALALSSFRNQTSVIDPLEQSSVQLQQIARLQEELINTRGQLIQLKSVSPNNPQIINLENRIQVLRAEIETETAKVVGGDRSLADKAAEYQPLILDVQFTDKRLESAYTSLEQARNDAQQQQVYLERIVQPSHPDQAMEPRRVRAVAATFVLSLIAWGILVIITAGVREHQD